MKELIALSPMTKNDRFQILSLDGGGIKGIFSAAFLAAIEEDLKINVVDCFDLICGTSTGGIIAIGLGLGLRPREIVEFYIREGPKIFPKWFGVKWFQQWVFRKYSAKPLTAALRNSFGDKKFGDSQKRLVICSYGLGADDIYLFRTPHSDQLVRDYKVPAWKVAVATSSAPTFFPCSREIDDLRLIDGGVWANNPSVVGIIEAFGTLKVPLNSIRLLSIGTTDPVSFRRSRLNSGGIAAWGLGNAAIDVILRGQSIGATNQARYLVGKANVERVNPNAADQEFSLHGVNKSTELIGRASHHSRIFTPTFKAKFADHRAAFYEPLLKP